MNSSFLRIALVLGLLSAVGPFSIDMYLPALPSIGTDMDASIGAVQASLMAYFVAMGAGQIIYGPVSDMVGRRLPMYFGLTLFCIGSVGCALAPDVHSLIALRFVQGLGACACVVIPRAIVRDLYTGHEAARVMALLMLVFSVSPILAPLAGSLLVEFSGWRSIFWVIAAIAVAALVLVATSLRETRPKEQRSASGLRSALAAYG
ncbi:MAG: Bcr/CflA family efflux MFS transporter, partial [Rhodoferax sp.]|nr:Bcr/CflA family efflux MFS transporter [Rhodoferax sp.]